MSLQSEPPASSSPEVIQRLVANHRRFLQFLEARVSSRSVAEDILQAAFVRGVEKAGTVVHEQNAVAWFYRLLRNALIDHYRRNASEIKARSRNATDMEIPSDEDVRTEVCQCINALLPTLKPEYADLIARVDLREEPLSAVALQLAITTNNATVRLHRARQSLKRQLERSCGTCATHGCLDCTCAAPTTTG